MSGEEKIRTEWHRIVQFAKLAEIAGEFLRRGTQVYVEQQLLTRSWQNEAGTTRYITQIQVGQSGTMQMLGGAAVMRILSHNPGKMMHLPRLKENPAAKKHLSRPRDNRVHGLWQVTVISRRTTFRSELSQWSHLARQKETTPYCQP